MKKTVVTFMILGLLAACTPDPFKSPDGSYDLSTGIKGNWELNKVTIEDRSFPQFSTKDISEFYASDPVSITFNAADQSYVVEGTTTGHPFGGGGFFAFDNAEYPENITITPDNADLGSVTLSLGNMVRSIDPTMTFLDTKVSCDQVYAQYNYTFNRKK